MSCMCVCMSLCVQDDRRKAHTSACPNRTRRPRAPRRRHPRNPRRSARRRRRLRPRPPRLDNTHTVHMRTQQTMCAPCRLNVVKRELCCLGVDECCMRADATEQRGGLCGGTGCGLTHQAVLIRFSTLIAPTMSWSFVVFSRCIVGRLNAVMAVSDLSLEP